MNCCYPLNSSIYNVSSERTSQSDNSLLKGTLSTENYLKNAQLFQETLERHSSLPFSQIEAITHYINTHLAKLLSYAVTQQKDLHLRYKQTGLYPPIEISRKGEAFLPLKCWGMELGKGKFRTAKIGIALSHPQFPIIAHSTETFQKIIEKKYSNSEVCILKKIAKLLNTYPAVKGLLKFYDSIDYQPKKGTRTSLKVPNHTYDDYVPLDVASEIKKEIPELNEKRSLCTKFYNHGSLQTSLQTLSLRNRIRVASYILQGLACLHEMKIFHSDIKADNIFLEIDPQSGRIIDAVIGDFGFACDLTNPADRFFKNAYIKSRAPEIFPQYLPPGSPINENILTCDIYSMGLLLKQLFSIYQIPMIDQFINNMLSTNPSIRPGAMDACLAFRALFKVKKN